MRPTVVSGLAALLVLLLAPAAYAPYHTPPAPPPSQPPAQPSPLSAAKVQANVAAQHAGFAARGETISYVRQHLRHVLMCIEGPRGEHVVAGWENPCKGMGNGVLVDLQRAGANPSLLNVARTADRAAVSGLSSSSLSRMKAAAKQAAALMTRIAQAK